VPSFVITSASSTVPRMSSASHNTRSQTNPNPAPPVVSEKIKITPTKVPRQETAKKDASEREAVIDKLADTEAQIAAGRAANRISLARPLLDDSQSNDVGGQVSNPDDRGRGRGRGRGHGHGRSQARSGTRGGGGGGGGRNGESGVGSRGRGRGRGSSHGPGRTAMGNNGQSAGVSNPGKSTCVLCGLKTHLLGTEKTHQIRCHLRTKGL
jgi:hypothetical protein